MTIYPDTKIAQIIKHNKASIEAIAAVARPFEKLRNPLLRKLLAGRTTLADAARIGDCDMEKLGAALKPLGFELVNEPQKQQKGRGALTASGNLWDDRNEQTLDVRADLASGQDPLKKIMQVVSGLPEGTVLRLINTFEPTPLISLLGNKGFESRVERRGPEEVHTLFRKRPEKAGEASGISTDVPELTSDEAFEAALQSFGGKLQAVDVREMEMPQPMITILEALQQLPEGTALLVTHRRIPIFLFPELKERSFAYLLNKRGDKDVRLLIFGDRK